MKPWLFNLLACPICKEYPLKLFIFSFESEEQAFKDYIDAYKNKDLTYQEKYQIPDIIEDDERYIKDNIIVEQTTLSEYLNELISILGEFKYIIDKTPYRVSKECFNLASEEIKDKFLENIEEIKGKEVKTLLPEIIFLNKLLVDTEIEKGILLCNNCHRWFPIIDSIPRMLPDEYRSKEKEIEFLNVHKDILGEHFFDKDLKPFSIDT